MGYGIDERIPNDTVKAPTLLQIYFKVVEAMGPDLRVAEQGEIRILFFGVGFQLGLGKALFQRHSQFMENKFADGEMAEQFAVLIFNEMRNTAVFMVEIDDSSPKFPGDFLQLVESIGNNLIVNLISNGRQLMD